MVLFLNLEQDYNSPHAQSFLSSNHNHLIETLRWFLEIPVPPERTKRDEAQITFLFRALLELSGGRVDSQQHAFVEEYSINENAQLCAGILRITKSNDVGDFDAEKLYNSLSKAVLFAGMKVGINDARAWSDKMAPVMRIGFKKEHLVRHLDE